MFWLIGVMMRKILLLFVIMSSSLLSQQISYIIPDIGSPNMNTYIEIIGPPNINSNFGSNGLYLNNPGDAVRIELVRPADSVNITFGPLIVSWGGRMISSQAFINPKCQPNSDNWNLLTSSFRIPVRVYNNGSYSNVDTFYIVKPTHLGDITSNIDRTLGQNSLGIRSKRGAMIVDSIKFANAAYTASINDCDLTTTGNQGYLPFVFLSKGKVEGGSLTIINGNGNGKDAGPGGGGGGGRFCDLALIGEDGGAGFTGGGAGGRNGSGLFSNIWKNPGITSGASDSSINGVPSPSKAWFESSGGGTGHPFGSPGFGCGDGITCDPVGGYSGGSGYRQNQRGGSGGYRTNGSNTGNQNGGFIIGNIDGIPIAGGSGGASGNPNSPNNCSGNGGGGGAAVKLFGREISSININANGASGGSSSYGPGGAGSGGFAGLESKQNLNSSSASVQGGNSGLGGNGLVTVSSISSSSLNFLPTGIIPTRIVSTDTSNFVKRKFTLKGGKPSDVDIVRIYIKSQSSQWALDTILAGLIGRTDWSRNYNLVGLDSLYYLVAISDRQTSSEQTYTNTLQYVMSQSSANILRKELLPIIDGDSVKTSRAIACKDLVVRDTFKLTNIGDAPLDLYFAASSFFFDTRGFTLESPKTNQILQPNDTVKVIIRYNYIPGQKGRITDFLLVSHNDPNAIYKPWRLFMNVDLDSTDYYFTDVNGAKTDTLDFGEVCLNGTKTLPFRILNNSSSPLSVKADTLMAPKGFSYSLSQSQQIQFNNYAVGDITFTPDTLGDFTGYLAVSSLDCKYNVDTLYFKGSGISGDFAIEKPQFKLIDTLNLGNQCIGERISDLVYLHPHGNTEINYSSSFAPSPSEFDLKIISNGFALKNDWDTIKCEMIPLRKGLISTEVSFKSNECAGVTNKLIILVFGVQPRLTTTGTGIFKNIKIGFRDTIDVSVQNEGDAPVHLLNFFPVAPPFRVISTNPGLPKTLNKGDTVWVKLEFFPQAEGKFIDSLKTDVSVLTSTCLDSAKIFLRGTASNTHITASVDSIYFGLLEHCDNRQDSVVITNPTADTVYITNIPSAPAIVPNDGYFVISQSGKTVIPPDGTSVFYITFSPKAGPDGVKKAKLVIYTSDAKNLRIEVKLEGEQENIKISADPTSLDFASVPIGNSKNLTVTLTNNGRINRKLDNVISFNPDVTVSPLKGDLNAGGGSLLLTVTYQPTIAGNGNTNLRFIFFPNCSDSFEIPVIANGIAGSVTVTPKVNFKLLPYCNNNLDSVMISNTGIAKISVDSMIISGTDAALFSFSDGIILPLTLDTAMVLSRKISYMPGSAPFGVKQADVTSYINVGGKTVSIITQLTAEKRHFLAANPLLLDFQGVVTSSFKDLDYTLSNMGNSTINITAVIPPVNSSVYTLIPDPSLTSLNVSDKPSFKVRFSPSNEISYPDSFAVISNASSCLDTVYIHLNGKGLPLLSTTMWIPDTLVDPRWTNFHLPVYGKINTVLGSVTGAEFTGAVSFNPNLFDPKSITKGTIVLDTFSATVRYIEFNVKDISLNTDTSIVTELVGYALLGNTDTTIVKWEKFDWKDKNTFGSAITLNGLIRTKVCRDTTPRLLKSGIPNQLLLSPNPAGDEVNLKLSLLEAGRHVLEIFNLNGEAVTIDDFVVARGGIKEFEYNLDLGKFSSGFYYILVKTPSRVFGETLMIVK